MDKSIKIALIAALAAIVAAFIAIIPDYCGEDLPQMSGQIESPQSGNIVERKINIKGNINNIPKDHHVWLAVKIDDSIWPKKPIKISDYFFV